MEPPAAIEIHIEELVLEGFRPEDRHPIAEAVTAELTRLASNQPEPEPREADLVRGSFSLPATAPAAQIGRQVAAAIYRGIRHE